MKDAYSIDLEMVDHVAKLASLDLESSEKIHFAEELNQILGHMQQLKVLNVSHIEASFQTLPSKNILRKDELAPSLSLSEVLQNAPEQDSPFFRMPPIMESE